MCLCFYTRSYLSGKYLYISVGKLFGSWEFILIGIKEMLGPAMCVSKVSLLFVCFLFVLFSE